MTEIEKTEGELKILQAKLELLKEMENFKSPVEEAYKRVYGAYPPTTPSVSNFEDTRWSVFQAGYNALHVSETPQERGDRIHKELENEIEKLQEKNWYVDAKTLLKSKEPEENEWKTVALLFGKKLPVIPPYGYDELSPNGWYMWVVFNYDNYIKQRDIESGRYPTPPQTPEQIEKSLREAFKKVQQTEEWKETQMKIDAPPKFLKFELGQSLTDLIYDWCEDVFTKNSNDDMENCIGRLVYWIEEWLPKEQSANSQNVDVEFLVEGFNDAIKKIKSKLR